MGNRRSLSVRYFVSQEDRSRKKIKAGGSPNWGRPHRMNKMHRKGRKQAKKEMARDRRILGQAIIKSEQNPD